MPSGCNLFKIWTKNEVIMWVGCAIVSAITIFLVFAFVGCPRVTLYYTIPIWATLLFFGPFLQPDKHPHLLFVSFCMLFFGSIWWIRTYPGSCRERWKDRLQFDDNWTNEAMLSTLHADPNLVPGVSKATLAHWLGHRGFHQEQADEGRLACGRHISNTIDATASSPGEY